MATPIRQTRPTMTLGAELGKTNPRRAGSTLYEDFHPALRGRKAAQVYAEMSLNDATIGSILFAVEQLVNQVEWSVKSDDDATREFLDENLEGLDHSWGDFVSASLSQIVYGWAIFEIVFKPDNGRIMWNKFAFRTQQSLHKWEADDNGDLTTFVQTLANGATVAIPAGKMIHFTTSAGEGLPEGRSWLRRAYRAWHMKKYVEDQMAIGTSRDLNGMPKGSMPAEELMLKGDAYEVMKGLVTGLKVDELQGLLLPSDVDPDTGQRLYDVELLSTSGRSKIDSLAFTRSLAMDIASVMLAQFIGLGRDAVGSRALAEPQQEMFQTALGALLDSMEEQFHRQATRPLLAMNGLAPGRITHGELRDLDLEGISKFVLNIAQAGGEFFPPDGTGMDEFRQMAGLQPQESIVIEDANVDTSTYTATPGAKGPES